MSTLRLGRLLHYLFTISGALAVVMQVLRPEWLIQLAGGHIMRPRTWAWQDPDLSLVTAVSSEINLSATYGTAAGMAICTYLWWRSTAPTNMPNAARLPKQGPPPAVLATERSKPLGMRDGP
jgi:hypothetical protein